MSWDSVVLNRDWMEVARVAGIVEGESIIPGVPLPDMSAETWEDNDG